MESTLSRNGQSGGTHRFRIGGRRDIPLRIFPRLDFSDVHVATDREQEKALALYRETLGLEPNQTYKFLGLFRILNVTLENPEKQIDWINQKLGDVPHPTADRIFTLQNQVVIQNTYTSIGAYLYAAGRSAMAHSFQPPFIDPDEFDDTYQINLDLPVLESLVDLYMERELGLPTR